MDVLLRFLTHGSGQLQPVRASGSQLSGSQLSL
jgi:hypothetical protein